MITITPAPKKKINKGVINIQVKAGLTRLFYLFHGDFFNYPVSEL